MSSITQYETKDGKKFWRCQYTVSTDPVTGKQKRTSKRGFKSQRDCELYLSRQLVQIDQHGYNEDTSITYAKVYEYFIDSYRNTVKESTLNHVIGMFKNHILPKIGKFKIKKITVPMCQRIVNDWSKEFTDYKKIRNYANLVFKEARRLSIIYDNPMELVIVPNNKPNLTKSDDNKFWDKKDLQVFLAQVNKYYGDRNEKAIALFRLMAFTGARKAEILALTVKDFSYQDKTVIINKTVSRDINNVPIIGTPKTIHGYRTLYLDQNTADILNHWISTMHKEMLMLGYNTSGKNQLIFPNMNNGIMSLMKPNKWMQVVIDSYNNDSDNIKNNLKLKRITPHGLRHTWITLAIESNELTIKQIQKQAGDSDVSTILNTYSHVSKQATEETIDKFTNYVGF